MKTMLPLTSFLAIGLVTFLVGGCAAQSQQTQTSAPLTNSGGQQENQHPALTNPTLATETAPEKFRVKFETTKGDYIVEVNRAWSPNGADRFYNMVKIGYFKDIAIFRAVKGFMYQFGIHGDPNVSAKWSEANFNDDPNAGISNKPGTICFAKTSAPNSRSTQMFVSLGDNGFLDNQGFTPFGKVVEGMDVVEKINTEYGENRGNVQGEFKQGGNAYILKKFPNIDLIKSVTIVE